MTRSWVGSETRSIAAGLLLVGLLGFVARVAAGFTPSVISEITLGVVLGVVVRNAMRPPDLVDAGLRFASVTLLRLGIVLLGARLSLGAVVSTGFSALAIILICVLTALTMTMLLGRALRLPTGLATLIAVGTAICGISAIIAVAPVIKARSQDISFAVATITLFGLAAVLAYPAIGTLLGLSDNVFGHWAGVAVNDTSQVTAAGFSYSDPAGAIATVVKLTRNTLIGPVIVGVGLLYRGRSEGVRAPGIARRGRWTRATQVVPLFVIGFLSLALLNSFGVIPDSVAGQLGDASKVFILMALVAIGLGTDLRAIAEVGLKPLYLGLSVALAIAALGLGLSVLLVR